MTERKARRRRTREIRDELLRLRHFIDGETTPSLDGRVAYAIETAIRWATEPTCDWPGMVSEAKSTAQMIRKEQP